MRVLTFRAPSIQEALQLVRENLGPNASVVSTRQVRRGFFAKSMIEVQASRELIVPSRFSGRFVDSAASVTEFIESETEERLLEQTREAAQTPSGNLDSPEVPRGTVFQNPNTTEYLSTPAMSELLCDLKKAGVTDQLAQELLLEACRQCNDAFHEDTWLIRGQLVEVVAKRLTVAANVQSDLNEQRIVAFVGPPGGGKSTMLCKVAIQATLENPLEIGIVAIDCWRNSAADQLISLAESVSAQVEAVNNSGQLAEALQRLRECDLVLIDTAGRSPSDSSKMGELQEFLQIAQPDEVHLVLGANLASDYSQLAIDSFSRLGATRLDITKLDEAVGTGQWLHCLFSSREPVQNLSYSADYKTGLVRPGPRYLASVLLGQKILNSSSNEFVA